MDRRLDIFRLQLSSVATVSAWGAAGEYVSHIYEEVKGRPRYFIMDTLE